MNSFNISEIKQKEIIPGYKARPVHSNHMTFAHLTIEAGAQMPAHSHSHEQVTHLISGQYKMKVDGVAKTLNPGDIVIIEADALHSGRAITDCHMIDSFYPIRDDFVFED